MVNGNEIHARRLVRAIINKAEAKAEAVAIKQ
jgi:hypothetical protein